MHFHSQSEISKKQVDYKNNGESAENPAFSIKPVHGNLILFSAILIQNDQPNYQVQGTGCGSNGDSHREPVSVADLLGRHL